MKIEDKRKPEEVSFKSLPIGSRFLQYNRLYMKLAGQYRHTNGNGICNAIVLTGHGSGYLAYFADHHMVASPIKNCTLIIED